MPRTLNKEISVQCFCHLLFFFSVFCSIKLSLSRNFILMTVCSGCCCVCCARLWCWCTTMLLSVWRNYPSPHYTRRIFFYDPQMTKYGHIGFTIDSVSNGFVYRIPLRWIVNGQKRVFFCEFKHIERRKKSAPSHSPSPNQMWHETTNSIGKFLLMV